MKFFTLAFVISLFLHQGQSFEDEPHNKRTKLIRQRFLQEGACEKSCETNRDCSGFVGGPNPCVYCNEGVCSETAPEGMCGNKCDKHHHCETLGPPGAEESGSTPQCPYCSDNGKCTSERPQGMCQQPCKRPNDCTKFVGGSNPCIYCVDDVCSSKKPQCTNDPDTYCYSHSDCGLNNGCYCFIGQYGKPNYCAHSEDGGKTPEP